ncbi:hypothetical protein OIU77_026108 [Salix suchowensis]|uniref:Uncharacterized protein n=1 Tax=Salix suchowensis TaxID=1278906 RepID=A0ABQ9BYK7_9ROSI|nr:hypothetical protein OIU77_026108 [Salix suchowensis]
MAVSKILIASLILSLLVLQEVSSIEAPANIPGKNTECGGASGKCSEGCKCVHKVSTSGIQAPCPCCGANMTSTPGGRRMSP